MDVLRSLGRLLISLSPSAASMDNIGGEKELVRLNDGQCFMVQRTADPGADLDVEDESKVTDINTTRKKINGKVSLVLVKCEDGKIELRLLIAEKVRSSFPLTTDEALCFCRCDKVIGKRTRTFLQWKVPDESKSENVVLNYAEYEVSLGVPDATVEIMLLTIATALSGGNDEVVKRYIHKCSIEHLVYEYLRRPSPSTTSDLKSNEDEILSKFSEMTLEPSPDTKKGKVEVMVRSAECEFNIFDPETNFFTPRYESGVTASVIRCEDDQSKQKQYFLLEIRDASEKAAVLVCNQLIDAGGLFQTDLASYSYAWNQKQTDSTGAAVWVAYSLRFYSEQALLEFSRAIAIAKWELVHEGVKFGSMKMEDAEYILKPIMQVLSSGQFKDETSADEDEPAEGGLIIEKAESSKTRAKKPTKTPLKLQLSESEESTAEEEEDNTESEEDETASKLRERKSHSGKTKTGPKNSQLAVGYRHDRSFVTRGSSIGVFAGSNDNLLQFHASIPTVSARTGKEFTPGPGMLLHQEDTSIILRSAEDPGVLHKVDLERGKVVEEWCGSLDSGDSALPITSIIPDSKYAQMTGNPTFIGLSSSALFRMDPRLPGRNKLAKSESLQYAASTRTNLTCGATTGSGALAVASKTGDVRLYNKLNMRAKTLLPGFGDLVKAVDSTESGKWLLQTFDTYLLLINTEIAGGKNEGRLGFEYAMGGANEKPIPIRLQLRPEHVAFMLSEGCAIKFNPARFDTGKVEEKAIVTSTGPYVITWNLNKVKRGHLYDYSMKRYSSVVVDDAFRYGDDESIVVALPDQVTLVNKAALSKHRSITDKIVR